MSIDIIKDQEFEAQFVKAANSIPIGSSEAGWASLAQELVAEGSQNTSAGFSLPRKTIGIWLAVLTALSIAIISFVLYGTKNSMETPLKTNQTEQHFIPIIPKEKAEKINRSKNESITHPIDNQFKTKKSTPIHVDTIGIQTSPTSLQNGDSTKRPDPFIFW